MITLATIGYQGTTVPVLIATMKAAGVTMVLDVRAVPWSRRPGFAKRALAESLAAAGIAYVHLGGLGNPKAGRDAARAGDLAAYYAIFAAHLDTPATRAHLDEAATLASAGKACLLCFERDAHRCHRRLVADALARRLLLTVEDLDVAAAESAQGTLNLPLP